MCKQSDQYDVTTHCVCGSELRCRTALSFPRQKKKVRQKIPAFGTDTMKFTVIIVCYFSRSSFIMD